ncbi:MAG: DUF4249 family protein [Bacteroidia bacterium]|nr:DUF4249 family protein [Bacteroidia bacterium]
MLKRLILVFITVAVTCSCMKEVAMDAMEDPQVVVECILCDGPVQVLRLDYTKGASLETAPDLPEAKALLTDLTEGKEAGTFTRSADGTWQLAYAAVPSHRYRLDVSVPGHEPVWAEQEMPEVPSIEVRWDWWRENLPEDTKYRMEHGYIFSVESLSSPVWFYGVNYTDMDSKGEITENLATDFPEVDRFNEQTSTYAGISAFGSKCFKPSAYPDLSGAANHRHYLRFPPREAERTEFLVSGDFCGYLEDGTDFVHSRKRFPELHYFAASEEYDKFLTDTYQLEEVSTSADLSSVFLRDNVYSNIHGAIGVFGAVVERTVLWDDDRYWGAGPFLLSGLESKMDYTSRALGDVDELHFDDLKQINNGWWQDHRQFSLLHYEVRAGYPEDWKYGIKMNPSEFTFYEETNYQKYRQTVYRIDNEEQLRDHGLEEYGPVDFSQKTVIVAYARGNNAAYIPYLMDYWVSENRAKGHREHVFYWVHVADYPPVHHGVGYLAGYVLNPTISSRVALVVDKIDESDELSLSWWAFWAHVTPGSTRLIEGDILPEMGITDFNKVVLY